MGSLFSALPKVEEIAAKHEVKTQQFRDIITMFDFDLFKQELEAAANLRKLKLIWRTAKAGPNGDETGQWNYNILIRKECQINQPLKTSVEILDEIQKQAISAHGFVLYLRTSKDVIGRDDQILYFNILSNTYEGKDETPNIEVFNKERFEKELQTIAENDDVLITMVPYLKPGGWQYNISIGSRTAHDVFKELYHPLDWTSNVEANLRIEEGLADSHPCSKLLYYNFLPTL